MKNFGVDLLFYGLIVTVVCLHSHSARSATPLAAAAQSTSPLASHKALYSISLTSVRQGADYADVRGKMAIEFNDACDAWTTSQKSLLRIVAGDGSEDRSNSEFTAWESKSGDAYTFSVKQNQNGEITEFRGRAKRNGPLETGSADYIKPDRQHFNLPAHFLFQTAQQIKLIEFAKKGSHFLNGEVFDGSEGGGSAHFNAIILKQSAASGVLLKSPILDSPAHKIRVAFYSPEGTLDRDLTTGQLNPVSGDEPEYEMTMTLHDNGVVSDYDYDYGDFSVHGKLEAIEESPHPHC
jgi:hypothetical protein